MRFLPAFVGLLSCFAPGVSIGQSPSESPASGTQLFNGEDLTGLFVYVDGNTHEPSECWRVEDGILRCMGVGKGYVRTNMAYADYRLHVEWRWPESTGNSGLLLHIVNGDVLWPKSFECQLATGRAGEFASFFDARSTDEIVSRNPRGVSTGRLPRPGPSAEKPLGEWNVYEAIVEGDSITLLVNGTEVNRMTGVRPAAGMIGLQAEGTPIDFRNFSLTPLPPAKDMHAPMPKELQ